MKKLCAVVVFSFVFLSACATLKMLQGDGSEVAQAEAETTTSESQAAGMAAPAPRAQSSGRNESTSQPTRAEVVVVQQRLRAAGYDPGPVDGVFGAKTKMALRKYKTAKGLPENVDIDDKTLRALQME